MSPSAAPNARSLTLLREIIGVLSAAQSIHILKLTLFMQLGRFSAFSFDFDGYLTARVPPNREACDIITWTSILS